jgi:hypothetical protein
MPTWSIMSGVSLMAVSSATIRIVDGPLFCLILWQRHTPTAVLVLLVRQVPGAIARNSVTGPTKPEPERRPWWRRLVG